MPSNLPSTIKIFKCECHTEGIHVETFDDEPEVYLSFWNYGFGKGHRWTIRERIRWCWNTLRKGYPFSDQAVLSPETAEAMGWELLEAAKVAKKNRGT